MSFIASVLISLAINIIAYAIMPKPKAPQPPETQDLENPTVDAGKPIPVVFGSIQIRGVNLIWYGEKEVVLRKIKSSGGKK